MKKPAQLCSLLTTVLVMSTALPGVAEVKPGDTISRDNIAQAEALLSPGTRWMVEHGMPMQVIETKKVQWPRLYKEATEKYAAQVQLAPDGTEIINYVAGCPFPNVDINDPLAGFRVIWNHLHSPYFIDNIGTDFVADLISSKGEIDRSFEASWRRLMWIGRLYTEPKPVIPHNPPVDHTNMLGPFFFPNDLKGLAVLYFRYLSNMADDTYLYHPEMRRVRHITEAERSDAIAGSDFDVDSFYGFNGNIRHWSFRVLAEKQTLGVVHAGKYGDPSAWCAPRDGRHGILAGLPCVPWEKRTMWIIEATPTGYPRTYAYSKRILYIDQDFFAPILQDIYDQQGELWKVMLGCVSYTQKPYEGYPVKPLPGAKYNYEDEWLFVPNFVLLDIKRGQATAGDAPPSSRKRTEWKTEWYFNEAVSINAPEVYSPSYLIQTAR